MLRILEGNFMLRFQHSIEFCPCTSIVKHSLQMHKPHLTPKSLIGLVTHVTRLSQVKYDKYVYSKFNLNNINFII